MSDTTVHITLAPDEIGLIESVASTWGCSPDEAASSLLSAALEREASSGILKKVASQRPSRSRPADDIRGKLS